MKNRTLSYVPAGRRRHQPAIDYEAHPVFSTRPFWRRELHRIVFGHMTPAGKLFDVLLIGAILLSVVVVMLESVESVRLRHGSALRAAEWVFTILFTIEYGMRLGVALKWSRYGRTFFGVVDLLSIVPTYLSLIVPGGQALAVIRILRILRVFRVLKLAQFVGGEQLLLRTLRSSAHKIAVFIVAILSTVTVVGSIMYLVEGPDNGFVSIPTSVYWAIVTLTTVGFGDIIPRTPLGQALASMVMVLGYGIIAVPTGIVTAEMVAARLGDSLSKFGAGPGPVDAGPSGFGRPSPASVPPTDVGPAPVDAAPMPPRGPRTCLKCAGSGHEPDARYCKYCGMDLPG